MVQIRIISGLYGGRKIDAPGFDNDRTKPMGERIRNAMFNKIGTDVQGALVLDAFAGTGSVGLEALSRGAAHVTFVERDRVAQNILAKNIAMLGCENQTQIVRTAVASWVSTASINSYDIIFADPPYRDPQFATVEKLFGLLKPGGLLVLSSPGGWGQLALADSGLVVLDSRSYGNAEITFFRRD